MRLDHITLISPCSQSNTAASGMFLTYSTNTLNTLGDAIKNTLIIRLYEFAVLAHKPDQHPVMPDDHSKSVPPLPIPNRTVKRLRADDSADPCVKVGHRQALIPQAPLSVSLRDGGCLLNPKHGIGRAPGLKRTCPSGLKQKTSECCGKTQEVVS